MNNQETPGNTIIHFLFLFSLFLSFSLSLSLKTTTTTEKADHQTERGNYLTVFQSQTPAGRPDRNTDSQLQ